MSWERRWGSQFPGVLSQEQQPSWTDDLPLCHLSGVGSASNRSYSADGKDTESHPPEDSWLKFRCACQHCCPGKRKSVCKQGRVLSLPLLYRAGQGNVAHDRWWPVVWPHLIQFRAGCSLGEGILEGHSHRETGQSERIQVGTLASVAVFHFPQPLPLSPPFLKALASGLLLSPLLGVRTIVSSMGSSMAMMATE